MIETNSTGTAELADLKPSEGEYFYTDKYGLQQYHGQNPDATCFVCGQRGRSSYGYHHIHAIAQCLAAGKRIVAMFKPEACYGPIPDICLCPGVKVIISACETHEHCAKILLCLTADGVITLERISRAEKSLVNRSEFNELVAKAAQHIWSRYEQDRSQHNWCDAWDLFIKESGHIPSLTERTERAKHLWQERKDGQATEDWLKAEKKVAALYTVDAQ
ncbi:MAG: DUF2934 domain-containing protein [bacterium]|nr:DUF2934 domain-containing protein [bacterium]